MKRFDEDMAKLTAFVLEMGELSADMIGKSASALKNMDMELADEVMVKHERIKFLDSSIEAECLRILILYQPMATDMRYVATVLKMITYLERIGKYSKNVAKICKAIYGKPQVNALGDIPIMADIAAKMTRMVIDVFETKDLSVLDSFAKLDTQLDDLKRKTIKENIQLMMDDTKNVEVCTFYMTAARYLERVGDHACKIAEKVVYMVSGKRVEIDK